MRGLTCRIALLVFAAVGMPSQRHIPSALSGRAGESCTTGQDLIVQALELLKADSAPSTVEDANQLLRRANDLCAESGEAWYYRYLVETRLHRQPQAALALKQANLFPSEALREGLNPFVLSTPPQGRSKSGAPIRQRWALVIGIGTFADQRIPALAYTKADATAFRNVLIDPTKGGFPESNVRLLVNASATLIEIKKSLNWLARSAQPEDLVVVYIASHGSPRGLDTGGASYILTNDTELDQYHVDPDALYASALAMVDLSNAVATRLKSLRTAVFLDTCYSGAAISPSTNHRESALDRASVSQATLQHISQGTGRVIFTASRSDQESFESGALQHGYFTYYLVEALRLHPGQPLSQIFSYVKEHVSQRVEVDRAMASDHQTPVLSRSEDGADFAIGTESATLSRISQVTRP